MLEESQSTIGFLNQRRNDLGRVNSLKTQSIYLQWGRRFEDQWLSRQDVAVVTYKAGKTNLPDLVQLFYTTKQELYSNCNEYNHHVFARYLR